MTQPQTPGNSDSPEPQPSSARRRFVVRHDSARPIPGPHVAFPADEQLASSDQTAQEAAQDAPLELESPLSPAEEQLRAQARQLAGYLRARKRDVERRERGLAKQAASELVRESDERQRDSARRRPTTRDTQTTAADSLPSSASVVPNARRLPAAESATAPSAGPSDRGQIEALEAMLREQWAVCERERRELADARRELADEAVRQRAEAAKRQQEAEAELAERCEQARRREERLDVEHAALEQLRAEVASAHQETLELRLACEQLWSQLADRMEIPALVRSIAGLRARLEDQYQAAAAAMGEQREAIEKLLERLDHRQKQLRRQRDDLQAWVIRRHEELELQAAQLLARQQELQRQERLQHEMRDQAQQEIRNYQRQVRQLTAQLRCKNELSRVA